MPVDLDLAVAEGLNLRLEGMSLPLTPRSRNDHPASSDDPERLRPLERAARGEPDDPDYHYILGEALLRAGRTADAASACGEAVQRDPGNPDYRLALGCAVWRLGRFEEAEGAFRDVVELRPGDARGLNALGVALAHQGRTAEAARVLQSAEEADAQFAEATPTTGWPCS